ncbi:ROK family transcriptional regulator [Evansella tamaricis]|uniref:ROK family transcriptional regulator n=1 Tax=Evansella tamaricis TaxID=2069301 RepID=A0ABS6JK15_9BACI|nr:ROK family transcriptional regulator [Evansella tamaricis]MBU9713883.1 ROK family transcriptional regulator [Evansella tamaricis]
MGQKVRVGNRELIKDINRSLVIEQVRNHAPVSRTEISKETKLGLSTVTKIVDELMSEGYLYESGEATSTGGRRPILLHFNNKIGYAIAVKIEQDCLLLAVTDLSANIIDKKEVPFSYGETSAGVVELLISTIHELLSETKIPIDSVLGIGVAVSGLVNSQDGRVLISPLLGWKNINLKSILEEEFDTSIYIDNDVNAYAVAEMNIGKGKFLTNFIGLSIGAGIGGAIVVNKKLYHGKFGGAGEFGHSIVVHNGKPCYCGQQGCLETYASEKYFKHEIPLIKDQFPDSRTWTEGPLTFDTLYQAAVERDNLALEVLKNVGEYLGTGLLNIINSFNPGKVILFGEGVIAKDYFLPYAIQRANNNFFSRANLETEVLVSELGKDAWLQGIALLSINHLFMIPMYEDHQR